jgi:hypothetical protein
MKKESHQLEKTLKILKAVSNKYSKDSIEYLSIESSAKALIFIHTEGHLNEFNKYLSSFDASITPEQKDFLKKNNIDE